MGRIVFSGWYLLVYLAAALAATLACSGCGTTQSQLATQQLIMSDAVDRAVARMDFSLLAGQKVYLDDRFIQNIKGLGFVNAEYVISALRQQLLASGCLLQESAAKADYIVEARVGVLGTDQHDVTYGIPPSKMLSTLGQALPQVPDLPAIPELSVARRSDQLGVAKVAAYVYHRETREPVWQSGTAIAYSDAKNSWILGIGPFQTGSIYPSPRFAGERLLSPFRRRDRERGDMRWFDQQRTFAEVRPVHPEKTQVQHAGHQTTVTDEQQAQGESSSNSRSGSQPESTEQRRASPTKEDSP